MRALSLFWVIALTCAAAGCADRRPRPEEALNAFLADLQYGRAEAAWAALSESSRTKLLERHQRLARAAGKPSDDTPAQILFGELGIVVMSAPESVVVVSPLGNEAKLRVTVAGGRSADIRMVREGPAWKVDLLGSLDEAPDLSAMLGQGSARTSTSTPSANSE
jgi:hypothetical protein